MGPGWKDDPLRAWDPACELCEEARFTEWFHEDDLCWVAECEACSVPMVVWRNHSPHPSDDVKAELHRRLGDVMDRCFEGAWRIDDHLRTIPTHYHAHARSAGPWGGPGLRRLAPPR